MRLFLAIEPPNEIKENIYNFAKSLAIGKLIPKENLHITLSFFGEANKDEIIRSIANLDLSNKKCMVKLKGIGAFPSLNFIRVLWVGAYGCDALLNELKKAFELDDVLHITFSRIKYKPNKAKIKEAIEKYSAYEFGAFEVDTITLFQSILAKPNPIYKAIFHWHLD